MKKILFMILFMMVSIASYSQMYTSYYSDTFIPGVEASEISSYVMWNVEKVDDEKPIYLVQFYHNLNDLPQDGKILVKLDNDKIIEFSYISNPTMRITNYIKNGSKVEYTQNYKMQIFMKDTELIDIASYGVKKIRVQTINHYIDLKTNIFNTLQVGYFNIKNKINENSLYHGF